MSTEATWFRTHPASPLLSGGVALLAFYALLIRIILKEMFADEVELGVFGFIVLGGAILVLAIIGGSYLLWRRTYFCLTEEFICQRSGKHNKQTTQVELTAVTAVDLKRSFLARIFGLAELVVRPSAGDPLSISLLPLERAQTLRRQILTSASASPDAPEEAGFDDGTPPKPAEVLAAGALDDGEVLATLSFKRQVTALAYRAAALGVPVAALVGTVGVIALTMVELPAHLWGLFSAIKTGWLLSLQIFLLVAAGIGNPVARRNH